MTIEIHGPTQATFADELFKARARVGVSQTRLAWIAGYDHSYVSRLESGVRLPTRDAVLGLAVALDCSDNERDRLLVAAGYLPESTTIRGVIDALLVEGTS